MTEETEIDFFLCALCVLCGLSFFVFYYNVSGVRYYHPTRGYKYLGDISNNLISRDIPRVLVLLHKFWNKVLKSGKLKL